MEQGTYVDLTYLTNDENYPITCKIVDSQDFPMSNCDGGNVANMVLLSPSGTQLVSINGTLIINRDGLEARISFENVNLHIRNQSRTTVASGRINSK